MASVRNVSENRKLAYIFFLHKVCVFLFAFTAWPFLAFASPQTQSKNLKTKTQVAPLPESNGNVTEVQWQEPTYQQISGERVRVIFQGAAKPGTKIQLQSGAVSINSSMKAHDLTIHEMAPSSKEITVGPNGRFTLSLTLPFGHVQIPIVAKSPPRLAQPYVIVFSIAKKQLQKVPVKEKPFKKLSQWNFGLEIRSVNYSQTNLNNLNETMLAPVISYQEQFAKRWSFQAESFIDAVRDVPFATNQNNDMARFWDSNADIIYSIPLRSPNWSIGIAGGFYYMTTFSSGESFGFTNLWGPEIYPIVRFVPNNKNTFEFYFKYAPVLSQMPFNFSNNESNAGIEWTKITRAKRSVSFKVELLQDSLAQGSSFTKSTAVNLGILFGVP